MKLLIAAFAAVLTVVPAAYAQTAFPNRPIRLVVPVPPGGAAGIEPE